MSFPAATRRRFFVGGSACLVLLAVLCVLAVTSRGTLDDVDRVVDLSPDTWFGKRDWRDLLLFVSRAFSTLPMAAYAVVAAALLALKRYYRAAVFVVVVITVTVTLSTTLKVLVGRPRRVLEHPVVVLQDKALPSGHSAAIAAAAGIAVLLTYLLVRKRSVRRLVALLSLLFVVVVGLDRLMLGVHTLTDVAAGYSLGAGVALLTAALFDPAPALIKAEPLAGPPRTGRRLHCVLNPVKVEDVPGFRALVAQLAGDCGWSAPVWHETTVEDPGRSMAEAAAVDGADLVLVCGGDGTVRTVCGELAGTGIPVGVVPAGTGNLLARNLALPLYFRSAIDVALNGQDRAIDIVRISGDGIGPDRRSDNGNERAGPPSGDDEHFLVMAGMGFDAAIMEGTNEQIKAKVGWVAYVLSGLRHLMFAPVRVEICVDDGPWTPHRARTIVVGNVGNLQGGLPLLPDATIDDGTLDLVLIYPRRFLSWLRVVVRVLSRNSRSDETVTRMAGRTIRVRASVDTPRQIDGDPIGAGREITCECLPGRLLVRVPR